jgi:ubiquinone/menaquinone biosynthesis C-methylase UbiE
MPALTPEQTRRVYDRIARAQDWQRFYEDPATTELVEHARFDDAHAVVELGCGTGRFAAGLLARHLPVDASYFGVDLSPRMVALASDRLARWPQRARVTLVDGGAGVPAADAAADRFVANYVFDLLGPDEARSALAEARRVLAPGGLLCATGLTPGARGLARFVSRA